MNGSPQPPLRIGDWTVKPSLGEMSRGDETVRLDARALRLLLCLTDRAGEVVSIDALLDEVWAGVIVTPDSVYQAITSLRRVLGDDPKRPTYIATVPRLGYRMIATVTPTLDADRSAVDAPVTPSATLLSSSQPASPGPRQLSQMVASTVPIRRRWPFALGAGLALSAVLVICVVYAGFGSSPVIDSDASKVVARPQHSIAVLPFLDLTTQEMNEEYFADGMTEELIGDLGRLAGFKVPSPTASFYFKDKSAPVGEIARQLGVIYVLDGSVRKSGTTFRVAARLIRADDGFIVWTDSYDRPFDNVLAMQKEIAAQITKSLQTVIDAPRTAAP